MQLEAKPLELLRCTLDPRKSGGAAAAFSQRPRKKAEGRVTSGIGSEWMEQKCRCLKLYLEMRIRKERIDSWESLIGSEHLVHWPCCYLPVFLF